MRISKNAKNAIRNNISPINIIRHFCLTNVIKSLEVKINTSVDAKARMEIANTMENLEKASH